MASGRNRKVKKICKLFRTETTTAENATQITTLLKNMAYLQSTKAGLKIFSKLRFFDQIFSIKMQASRALYRNLRNSML